MIGECVIINLGWLQCQSQITLGEEASSCSMGADKDDSISLTLHSPILRASLLSSLMESVSRPSYHVFAQ